MPDEKSIYSHFKAGIVLKNLGDEFLLVKEAKVGIPQPDGSVKLEFSDDGKWKLPGGCLREGDDFELAANAVGMKVSGHDFDMHEICYIGFCKDDPCVVVIYYADRPYSIDEIDPPDPEETAAVYWFTYDEILRLREQNILRDPELTLAAIENVRKGFAVPPEIIAAYPPKERNT